MKTNEGGAAFGAIGKERSKLLATVLAVLMVMSAAVFALSGEDTNADAWDGTSATEFTEAPTQISSAADLKGFADWVNAGNETSGITVELTTDIDLGGYAWEPIGMSYRNGTGVTEASYPFEGTFDGSGYAITGLNVVKESYQNEDGSEATLGLFGTLNGGTVENLIVGGTVSGYDATGLIVGFMFGNSTVDNCFTTDSSEVSGGDNTGGIVGKIYGGSITDSSNYAVVESSGSQFNANQAKAGGIVAHADARTAEITISNISNHGDVITDDALSGGIIGMIQATGTISVNSGIDFSTETAIGSSPTSENVTVSNVGTVSERYPGVGISATAFIGTVDNVSMNNSLIFLNGTDTTIEEGVTAGWTRILTSDGDLICHANLSRYSVYGGSSGADVDSVSITMNGGSMYSVAGGGYLDATVTSANVVINGGNLSYGVSGGGYCGSLSVDDISDMTGYNYTGTVTITINGGTMAVANAGGAQSYAYVETATMTINGGTFDEIIAGGINGYTNTSKVTLDAAEGSSINAGLVTTANRGEVNSADIDIIDLGDGQINIIAVGSLSGTTSTDGGPNGVVDDVDLDIASEVNISEGVFLGGAQWGVGKHNPWDTSTENALIKADITINAPGRTIFGSDVIPNTDYEVETVTAVNYTIGADNVWNITAGTVQMEVGHSLSLEAGATFDGMISGPDGITADFNNLTAGAAGLTITIGSFIIDGETDDTQESSATFSDGAVVEGTNAGVDYIFDGSVTFNDFTQGDGTLTFKDAEGNEYTDVTEAIEAGVDIRLGSNTSLSDLPFSTVDMNLEFTYDGTAHSPATGIPFTANEGYTISSVYISGGNCVSGEAPNMAVTAQTNVGIYTIQYTLVITDAQGQSTTYSPTIEWSILPQDVEITHEDISKEYDGTDDVDQTFSGSADGLTLGNAYYTDINAGEGKEVRLPIVIAEGSVAENYTFTVNGVEAELMGDAEAGYYIVLQGTITQKEITVDITAKQEYDGDVFKHPYSGSTGIEGDILTVTVTTTGSDAKTYSGADLEYGGYIVMNGETYVSTNYVVNYNPSNTLTIDPRDIIISPATGAVITKEYNGWSSRIMSESDFQMSGAIDGDDVSFGWTPGASNIWYNSSNVLEANTLTVNGLFLEGEDSSNYELPNTTVMFVDGENGLTVGITPMVLTISNGSGISIEKTYDNRNTVPSGQIDTNDYSVSAAQNGTYPDININAAVFGSVDAGTDLTVYVTDATLVDGDNGVASNFALPEMQTYGDIKYYFSITGANVKINPITVDGTMVKGSYSEQDEQIILTVTVTSGKLELTEFASTLSLNDTAIKGTGNSYVITAAGEYKATITSTTDRNWSVASPIEATLPVSFDYTADFYTKDIIDGKFVLEQTVFFDNGSVLTPNATNVPDGYELVGWETSDGTRYDVGVYAPISAIGTDFYAVYEEIGDDPSDPSGPTVTIDIPDSFTVGEEIEFSVSTTRGDYTGRYVQGTGIFEGIPGVDYIIWYKEVIDGPWYPWEDGNFGPSSGFPLSDATSEFKIQFINAGTYDLTVQIVTVEGGDVVCETTAVVDVPAESTLGYHVIDAADFVYTDDAADYNANAYEYAADLSADANGIVAAYGSEYYDALVAYIMGNATDNQKAMAASVMNDFARYMGALYRSSDGDVGRVYFNGTEYVWKADADGDWLHGSNWRDASGVSLTSVVTDYIEATQNTRIVMEIAVPGGERQVLTYGAVFENAPAPEVQYYDVTITGEGVAIYIDGLRYFPGTHSMAEGEHTIGVEVLSGYTGTPVITNVTDGKFTVSGDMTIAISGVTAVVDPEPEKELPGIEFDMPVFIAGQDDAFRVTFIANDYVGQTVTVKATFSGDPDDITSIRYWNVNINDWDTMVAEAGGSYVYGGSGFTLSDATSAFRATFANAGVYTLTVHISIEGKEITRATETFIVEEAVVAEYYNVTFNVDDITSTVRVLAGEYVLLATPSKDGYTFGGWYVEGDDATLYTLYYTPSDDVTLIAKFTENQVITEQTYSVAFGEVHTQDGLKAGDVVTMPVVTPEENYRLVGWETENGIVLTGQQYYVYAADDADEDSTITLKPVFEKYVFTVTVNGDGNGSVGTTTMTVEMGETAVITGVAADPGYYVESITANMGYSVVDYGGTYVIFDVADDITVTITFAADPGAQDITMTAALTEGGVVVNMSSNDGGNLPTGTIQVIYTYTVVDQESGIEVPRIETVTLQYNSVNQISTQQTVEVTFPASASVAYAQFVVGEEVRTQTGYFGTFMES